MQIVDQIPIEAVLSDDVNGACGDQTQPGIKKWATKRSRNAQNQGTFQKSRQPAGSTYELYILMRHVWGAERGNVCPSLVQGST